MKEAQDSASAYAAATQILRDCNHADRQRFEYRSNGCSHLSCFECWNEYLRAHRAARKLQLAEHRATLPACEGEHAKHTPARWSISGVHLCGRCKTKAKKELYRRAASAGNLAFLHMFAPPSAAAVRNAAKGGSK